MKGQNERKHTPRTSPHPSKVAAERPRGRANGPSRQPETRKQRQTTPKKANNHPQTANGSAFLRLPTHQGGVSVIPWTNILGDGEKPLAERTHRDGQGLVVLLGPLDTLILDLPEQLEALPEQLVTIPEPLVTLPVGPGARPRSRGSGFRP